MIRSTIFFASAIGTAATTQCSAGYRHKEVWANLYCSDSSEDAESCNGSCCVKDDTTCGGLGLTCPFDKYHDNSDEWKRTKATANNFESVCCKPKATCANTLYVCPAGFKKKETGVSSLKCSSDAASCANGPHCCEEDLNQCGGFYAKDKAANPVGWATAGTGSWCPAGLFPASSTDKVLTDSSWKKIQITSTLGTALANFQADCCAAKATCGSPGYSCPAGQKRTKDTTTVCKAPYSAQACASTPQCCTADTEVCGGVAGAINCAADKYYPGTVAVDDDDWKRAPTQGAATKHCCTAKATCAKANCAAGYKKKSNVDAVLCDSDAESCNKGKKCCELDMATCGGLHETSGINCPYGFYNEAATFVLSGSKTTQESVVKAWYTKVATENNKNTVCCTPKAKCSPPDVTTTPPLFQTTTPSGLVRLYGQHAGAVKAEKPKANMMWLGIGALVGGGVLMAVYTLHSRSQAPALPLE